MKRIICTLLVVVMLLGTLTGCSNKVSGNGKDKVKYEDAEGTVKLTVGVMQNMNVTSYTDNAFTKYLEENLDVELEFVYFSSSITQAAQQLALMVGANEELPDVLLGFIGLGQYDVYSYGEDGYFLELGGLIEQYGSAYKAAYEKLDADTKRRLDGSMINPSDGAIYAMPSVAVEALDNLQSITYINQDWLDAVGMQAPTNIEELYNVLKAFKENDLNGNGKADELAMLGGGDLFDYLINAFVYYDADRQFNVTDGKVWNPAASDEYRQALTFIKKLLDEQLLSDLSLTLPTIKEFSQLITPSDDVAKVGIWCGHPTAYTSKTTTILNQYTALKYLEDATGKGGQCVASPVAIYLASYITKDCESEKLVRAMKLLDFFYEAGTVTRMRHGEYGVDWTDGEGVDVCGVPNNTKVINAQAFFEGDSTWCSCIHAIYTNENFLYICDEENEGRETQVNRLCRESTEVLQAAKEKDIPDVKDTIKGLRFTAEENAEREQYTTMYTQYVNMSRASFLSGEMDIEDDATWNEYVETLKNVGEEILMKNYQASWDRLYGKK